MGHSPSVKLDQGPGSIPNQPLEFEGFGQVRFESGVDGYVNLFIDRGGPSVAYFDGTAWQVTDGNALGDPILDGTTWGVILGQAK